jgi:hypothetical protein
MPEVLHGQHGSQAVDLLRRYFGVGDEGQLNCPIERRSGLR